VVNPPPGESRSATPGHAPPGAFLSPGAAATGRVGTDAGFLHLNNVTVLYAFGQLRGNPALRFQPDTLRNANATGTPAYHAGRDHQPFWDGVHGSLPASRVYPNRGYARANTLTVTAQTPQATSRPSCAAGDVFIVADSLTRTVQASARGPGVANLQVGLLVLCGTEMAPGRRPVGGGGGGAGREWPGTGFAEDAARPHRRAWTVP